MVAVAAITLTAFVLVELRVTSPLVHLRLLRDAGLHGREHRHVRQLDRTDRDPLLLQPLRPVVGAARLLRVARRRGAAPVRLGHLRGLARLGPARRPDRRPSPRRGGSRAHGGRLLPSLSHRREHDLPRALGADAHRRAGRRHDVLDPVRRRSPARAARGVRRGVGHPQHLPVRGRVARRGGRQPRLQQRGHRRAEPSAGRRRREPRRGGAARPGADGLARRDQQCRERAARDPATGVHLGRAAGHGRRIRRVDARDRGDLGRGPRGLACGLVRPRGRPISRPSPSSAPSEPA